MSHRDLLNAPVLSGGLAPLTRSDDRPAQLAKVRPAVYRGF